MRELSVYYCPKCGHYGYFQLPKNAVCPKCNVDMVLLSISYQDFMDLNCKERDDFLAGQIIESASPFIRKLTEPHRIHNTREIIARMNDRIIELEAENKKLNETVAWMHQTIWDLVRKSRGLDIGSRSAADHADQTVFEQRTGEAASFPDISDPGTDNPVQETKEDTVMSDKIKNDVAHHQKDED